MATIRSALSTGSGFDAPLIETGALTVALAHGIAAGGVDVLVLDADAHGTRLAQRIAAATKVRLRSDERGLPTLVASRASLGPDNVVRHCWTLPKRSSSPTTGSVLLAAAPCHPDGALYTAAWLAERAEQLAALGQRFAVVVSLPGAGVPAYRALQAVAHANVVAAPRQGTAAPGGRRAVLAAFGLHSTPDPVTVLCAGTLLGAVGPVSERVLLGARPHRREHAALGALETAAARLSATAACAAAALARPGGTR